jgi:hypothetical protein
MSAQLDLFAAPTPPAVRTTDPTTSVQAAAANPVRRGGHRLRVLEALAALGTATDCQLAAFTGLLRGSAAKRRGELVAYGYVTRAGRGITDTGSPAFTWEITAAGRLALEGAHNA